MAVLHRALVSWFLGLVFLILLVIRLDGRTTWNWFIVFIPLWIFDSAVLTYAGFYVVSRARTNQLCSAFILQKLTFVVLIGLKLTLQILLCLKLEGAALPLYYAFIPLWALLAILILKITAKLLHLPTLLPSK